MEQHLILEIQEGTLESMSAEQPTVEFYSDRRAVWVPAVDGAEQKMSHD